MRQRILLIILGVVILLAIYTFFLRPKPRTASILSKTKSKIQEKASAMKDKVATKTPVKDITKAVEKPLKTVTKVLTSKPESVAALDEYEKGKWGTDPFIRDWVLGIEIKDLKLKAITQSGTKAYALINDQIVETGEVIAGKKIVSIEKDKVVLEQGSRMFTLLLGQ